MRRMYSTEGALIQEGLMSFSVELLFVETWQLVEGVNANPYILLRYIENLREWISKIFNKEF